MKLNLIQTDTNYSLAQAIIDITKKLNADDPSLEDATDKAIELMKRMDNMLANSLISEDRYEELLTDYITTGKIDFIRRIK